MSEYIDNLIAEALGQVHGQSSRRRYSVAEVKQIVYPLIGALRDPAALESVQRPFPVDGAPMGGDPAVVVRGAVRSDVATSAPDVVTSPERGKPVAVQPVTPDREALLDTVGLAIRAAMRDDRPVTYGPLIEDHDYYEYVNIAQAALDALLPLLGQPRTDEERVLVTHPHDGHAPNETCLECRTDAPLDPEPWTSILNDQRFPEGGGLVAFKPRPDFEQVQARYPRTDDEEES